MTLGCDLPSKGTQARGRFETAEKTGFSAVSDYSICYYYPMIPSSLWSIVAVWARVALPPGATVVSLVPVIEILFELALNY